MFQNLLGRLPHAARRSGCLQGPWSAGDARGGWAWRSAHQNSGLECRTAQGTVESPTSDPQARQPAMSKQSPDCLLATMTVVEHPVEDPQIRSESREEVRRRTPKEPTGSSPPSSSV
ncbi:unnamed protein product [Prunus brigantina]